jgi:hypothetical protein
MDALEGVDCHGAGKESGEALLVILGDQVELREDGVVLDEPLKGFGIEWRACFCGFPYGPGRLGVVEGVPVPLEFFDAFFLG